MDTQRLPKKEEQEVEEAHNQQPSSTFQSTITLCQDQQDNNSTDGFDFFGINNINNLSYSHELVWEFWDEEEEVENENVEEEVEKRSSTDQEGSSYEFWDNFSKDCEDKELSLKLNLNHQEVIDAWSDRRLWTDSSMSRASANSFYRGEVPVMDEERNTRREASVLRYKEKRQSRLFSKKIRYEVRKLNADKRPRFKGRFVKRDT